MIKEKTSLWDRTLTNIQRKTSVSFARTWEGIAGTARAITGAIDPDLPKKDAERIKNLMNEALSAKGGEISARKKTVELGGHYLALSDKGKTKFLGLLASEFDLDRKKLAELVKKYIALKSRHEQIELENLLRDQIEAKRVKILKQFSALPDGIKFLVDLREDLLAFKKNDDDLVALEKDMKRLLASWFDIGLLDMREITWNSPTALLEKLIAYEAVHKIKSWSDLKNRLDTDRRCFAFFHPKMPNEPLIFVQIALVDEISSNIMELLDETKPAIDNKQADTAIFYSITNAQAGLSGISFGNFLIKRVVDSLSREFKNIKIYATLSPIPGFMTWIKKGDIPEFAIKAGIARILEGKWHENKRIINMIKDDMLKLCAHYLINVKKSDKALDPVAHFHLSNGAKLERINWMADLSEKGLEQSAGMMVNYQYVLSDIDENHEAYSSENIIPISRMVKNLLK